MASGVKGSLKPSGGAPHLSNTYKLFGATATTTVILSACNQAATPDTIRIAVVDSGTTATSGAIDAKHYIEYDFSLSGNSAMERTGITLENTGRIMVGSGAGNVSFSAYGIET